MLQVSMQSSPWMIGVVLSRLVLPLLALVAAAAAGSEGLDVAEVDCALRVRAPWDGTGMQAVHASAQSGKAMCRHCKANIS
jgi:hypothetical protein